jgi:phosphotransacetylase
LAFDNAISRDAAQIKGILSPVAGDPDILLTPDLESGNILSKQLIYLAGAASAGVVMGAKVPIVLNSRSDDARSRLVSAAVAALIAEHKRKLIV